jgi:2-polyprenyl-3-methyl-5-hydroxy-6-metoxy-1,4-benzoquinol methylase
MCSCGRAHVWEHRQSKVSRVWNPLKALGQERSRNVDEHFVPGRGANLRDAIRAGDQDAVHHLIRYEWAARCLADWPVKSILDLASGNGYGAFNLAARVPSTKVTGVDYDAKAVEQARARYALPNLGYRTGDATRWGETIGPERFDAIVSFDMIEHVVHREIMMESLVGHLAPGGALLLSTPCGHLETVVRPVWVHHRIEYSLGSLYDFLHRYFEVVIEPDDREFPHRDVFDLLSEGPVTYFLKMNPVVCRKPIVIESPYR